MTLREEATTTIRTFSEEDLDDVIEANLKCLPENYPSFFYLDLHERFPQAFLVAETPSREIVGYVMCRVERGFSSFGFLNGLAKKGHVISIAVLPDYRRRGIGTRLMKRAQHALREEHDADECYLEVRKSSEAAISLYEELGFKKVKTNSNYYRDSEDALTMAKKL